MYVWYLGDSFGLVGTMVCLPCCGDVQKLLTLPVIRDCPVGVGVGCSSSVSITILIHSMGITPEEPCMHLLASEIIGRFPPNFQHPYTTLRHLRTAPPLFLTSCFLLFFTDPSFKKVQSFNKIFQLTSLVPLEILKDPIMYKIKTIEATI